MGLHSSEQAPNTLSTNTLTITSNEERKAQLQKLATSPFLTQEDKLQLRVAIDICVEDKGMQTLSLQNRQELLESVCNTVGNDIHPEILADIQSKINARLDSLNHVQ